MRLFLAVSALSVTTVGTLFVFVSIRGFVPSTPVCLPHCPDHIYYRMMRDGHAVPAPFAYRLLTPAIARLIPFSVITFASLSAFLVTLFYIQAEMGVRPTFAVVGLLLCALTFWTLELFVIDNGLVDPLSLFLIAAGVLCVLRSTPEVALGFLALSILNKESGVILAAPIVIWGWKNHEPSLMWVTGVVCLAAFAGPHLLIRPSDSVYGIGGSLPVSWTVLVENVQSLSWGVWGVLIVLALFARPADFSRYSSLTALALLTYAQLPFATDTNRLLAPAAIAIIPFAMLGLQRFGTFSFIAIPPALAMQAFAFVGARSDLYRLLHAYYG